MRILKWVLILAGVLAVLVLGARFFFAEQIGKRGFQTALTTMADRSAMDGMEDGLHVILLGTGSPMPDPSRAGPSTAVIAGDRLYVVDSGGGSVRNIGAFRVPIAALDAVFLTHTHSDHIDGLGELGLQYWAGGGADTPLEIYGPTGTAQVAQGLTMAYSPDAVHRIAHHGEQVVPRSGFGFAEREIKLAQMEQNSIVLETDAGLKVTAFRVDHDPVTPAFGYRFDYKGRSVTLSGDTDYDPRIAKIGQGSDLLIHEALNEEMVNMMKEGLLARGDERLATIMHDILDYHASPVEAAEIASEAGADMLIYSHIVPVLPSRALYPYFLKGTKEAYDGPIVVGEDGMMFSLPAGSDKIERRRLD